MKITFLGATKVVTGSKYLIEKGNAKILVDCGLFQGGRDLRKRNWDSFPIDPRKIDAVVLTHAHIDHTGYLPLLVKNGFKGVIYCSEATKALCEIMLIDSASLQEEDAKRSRRGSARAEPLYTVNDAQQALQYFKAMDYDKPFSIADTFDITLICAGHILGAAFVIVSDGKKKLTFSGDLGRPNQLIMKAPPALKTTDYLVLESTYGDRLHQETDPVQVLGEIVNATAKKGGVVLIPAFAVGRTQMLLYGLYQLKEKNIIPDIPVFLDSPMAISVSNLLCKFSDEHTLPRNVCIDVFKDVIYTRTQRESRKLDKLKGPAVIIAGSGMADGGRIGSHLKRYISHAKNTVVFVGFQAHGTEGRALTEGVKRIQIYKRWYPVRASIKKIHSLSAHADYNEILDWLSHFTQSPKTTFLTHGELESAEALKEKIEKQFGWHVVVPDYLESFDLE